VKTQDDLSLRASHGTARDVTYIRVAAHGELRRGLTPVLATRAANVGLDRVADRHGPGPGQRPDAGIALDLAVIFDTVTGVVLHLSRNRNSLVGRFPLKVPVFLIVILHKGKKK
jgi:hypothetical protein